jgi:hypothetical protein
MNLDPFFQIDGLAYRIVPIRHTPTQGQMGSIDLDVLYDNMVNKFRWGGVDDPDVYLDENIKRMLMNFRNNFGRLALECLEQGDTVRAKAAVDRCMEVILPEAAPMDYFMIPIADACYRIGDTERANTYIEQIASKTEEELRFFLSFGREHDRDLDYDMQVRLHTMRETVRLSSINGQTELFTNLDATFKELIALYESNS